MEKNILSDSNLEALNIIKEIDTLSIIRKADEITKKKDIRRMNFIGITTCILLIIFNLITLLCFGLKIFIILQICILWVSPIFIVLLIKRLSIKGEIKWR